MDVAYVITAYIPLGHAHCMANVKVSDVDTCKPQKWKGDKIFVNNDATDYNGDSN